MSHSERSEESVLTLRFDQDANLYPASPGLPFWQGSVASDLPPMNGLFCKNNYFLLFMIPFWATAPYSHLETMKNQEFGVNP
jgi:hypothetical protein